MSLMLNALKRIEAKQASARAAAPAAVEPGETAVALVATGETEDAPMEDAPVLPIADSCAEHVPAACGTSAGEECTEDFSGVFEDRIELPPELKADSADELSTEEIALPGEISLESAMNELMALLAEARLIDQPPPAQVESESACSAGFSRNLGDCPDFCVSKNGTVPFAGGIAADDTGFCTGPNLETSFEEETAGSEPNDCSLAQEALDHDDVADSSEAAVIPPILADHASVVPERWPAETTNAEPAISPSVQEAAEDSGIEDSNAAIEVSPEESTAIAEAEQVFAEPPVIEPIGSDPYAAAAWQLVRQLPQIGDRPDSRQAPGQQFGRNGAVHFPGQIVLFTSPGDGHGKTMTLARLLPHVARSFSGSVLAVDANTRNPDLARWLEVAVTWRLTDVLAGATHWMNAVRPTALPRVSLLPGGTDISRQSNAHAAARLLRELASHYDLVLVDASSLAHAGAGQLAAACDGTCLVVRLGEGSRRIIRESVRVLSQSGGRLLGCIAIDAGA